MIILSKVKIRYSKSSQKFFEKHQLIKEKFKKNIISKYEDKNSNIDLKKMVGYEDLYRIRIGDYRVIYKIAENQVVIIDVLLAGSHGEIYKKLYEEVLI